MMKLALITSNALHLDGFLNALAAQFSEWEQAENVSIQLVSLSDVDAAHRFLGKTLTFDRLDDTDFSVFDCVFVLDAGLSAEAAAQYLAAASCKLVIWEEDLSAFEGFDAARLQLVPSPLCYALNLVLNASGLELSSVEKADVIGLLPVSVYGEAGVGELASQTAKLLNAQNLEPEVFNQQMPFNYFSSQASTFGQSYADKLAESLKSMLSDASVQVRALQMPVFHGYSAMVNVELATDLKSQADVEEKIGADNAVNIQLHASAIDFANAGELVLLADVAVDSDDSHALSFQLGFDEAKFGVIRNWVSHTEKLLKSYLY